MINSYEFGHRKSPKGLIIAIDGPVASGKGTVVKKLVKKLSAVSFYTGGMYRALALKCIKHGIDFNDEKKAIKLLDNSNIELKAKRKGEYSQVFLDGENVTDEIFKDDVAEGSSIVSHIKTVRGIMVKRQRELALINKGKGKIVIMEGRDMGTKVVVDADLKIFLTASVEVRARRRQKQYSKRGTIKSFEEVISEIKIRDKRDIENSVNPLASEPQKFGYIVLDNSKLSVPQTVDKISYLVLDKLNI